MDGSTIGHNAQRAFRHDVAVAELQKTVAQVAAAGGDFDTLRAGVRMWVEQFATYPCRTAPTTDGVCVYYTTRTDEGVWVHESVVVVCEERMLAVYQAEYENLGW